MIRRKSKVTHRMTRSALALTLIAACFDPLQALAGTLVDGRIRLPGGAVAGAYPVVVVALSGPLAGRQFSRFANDRGQFQIDLPPGEYRIAPAYQPAEAAQHIPVSGHHRLQVLESFTLR